MKLYINYNFYCGTSRGFIASATWKTDDSNAPKPQYNTEYKGDEIASFEFGRSTNEIVVGTVKGNIRLYDVISQSYILAELHSTNTDSEVVGSGTLKENIVFCRKNGIVNVWNPTNTQTSSFTIPIGNDGDVRTFRLNEYRDNLFAVAGHKYEYALWDMEQKRNIFAAKSLPADQLYQLPQTTFANDLCMMNFGGGHVGAIVTAEGVTMLYDDRAQRRPVFILKKETKGGAQTSFTCVKPAKGVDHLLTIGTTRGAVHLLDLRTKLGYMGAITGFNGAVTSLAPMFVGEDSAIASTCLDGNLRVHCVRTKKLLYKMYMKVGLKGVLTQPVILKPSEIKGIEESEGKGTESTDLDNIFAEMETIADEIDDDSNVKQQKTEVPTQKTKKKNKKTNEDKSKSRRENEDDDVEIKLLGIKAAELQRMWKEDIAKLIITDPYKQHMDYLLNKEIKIEDEEDLVEDIEKKNEGFVQGTENTPKKKLKRKNDDGIKSEDAEAAHDAIKDKPIKKKRNNSIAKTKLKAISMIEVLNKSKESKNFGKKKSKNNVKIRVKAV